jgi:nondiscriminating glutamyl-tRNA synthetase
MTAAPGKPRLRFAPSPTGRLHVGGARTALFNWLLARHHGGTLVIRIEDTDVERSTAASEQGLLADLAWLGIDWDEGPDRSGPHAPYRQSERRSLYAAQVSRLVDAGLAYPCFCSADVLGRKRGEQREAGVEPRYDGTCRGIAPAEAQRRMSAGEPAALRYHVPERRVEFTDRVRGRMHIDTDTFGDFVLVRSNGLPTYNFACVVDDASMQISLVVRGEDHLYNTARQVLLYEGLRLEPPEFAHLALILDEDRGKLSKREGREGTYVDEYRSRGYLPEALVNFLALLGWSSPSGDEILDALRLVREFDLDRVSKSPAVFDTRKWRWMAGAHLRARSDAELAERAEPFLRAVGLDSDAEQRRRWVAAFKDGIACLAELPERVREFLQPGDDPQAAAVLEAPGARRLLATLAERLDCGGAMDGKRFHDLLGACGKELGVRGKELFQPVRVALSGRLHGPELPLLFDVMGCERARSLLRDASGSSP